MYQKSTKFDLLYCHSSPLMCLNKPLPALDTKTELKELINALNEIHRSINIRAEIATYDSLMSSLTLGTRVLHYSGHGKDGCLAFEPANKICDNAGDAQLIKHDLLQKLLNAGGNSVQLAFVCACESHLAGLAFTSAGVPHVIAAKEKISDLASQTFAKHFYLSLFTGKSVYTSFKYGQHAVQQTGQDNGKLNEQEKFELLPYFDDNDPDNYHKTAILFDLSDRSQGHVSIDYPRSQEPLCIFEPTLPSIYWGRNQLNCDALRCVLNKNYRLTCLQGETGIGKSSLLKVLGNYISERRHYHIGSIGYCDLKNVSNYCRDIFGMIDPKNPLNSLSSLIARNTPIIRDSLIAQKKDIESNPVSRMELISELKHKNYNGEENTHLLMLDSIDLYPNKNEVDDFILNIIDKCGNVKIIISYTHQPVLSTIATKIIINPLPDEVTAQLLIFRVTTMRPNISILSFNEKLTMANDIKAFDIVRQLKGNPLAVELFVKNFVDQSDHIKLITFESLKEYLRIAKYEIYSVSNPSVLDCIKISNELVVETNNISSIITAGDPCLSPGADNFPMHSLKTSTSVNSLDSQLKAAFSSPGAFDLPSVSSQNNLKSRVSISLQESQSKLNPFSKSPINELSILNENGRMVWNSLGVSNQCLWSQLSHALHQYFKTFASFERLLDSHDLKFLLAKLNPNNNELEPSRTTITLDQFEKFWPWFEQICVMISFFLPLWVAQTSNPSTPEISTRLIHGFVSKQKVIELLSSVINVDGTFILRFSESRLSCLAVSYVDSGRFIHSLIEWYPDGFVVEIENKKKVKYSNLTELILKCKMFSNLFPNVNKNRAFTLVFAESSPD